MPVIKAFKHKRFGDEACIGLYENEVEIGGSKFVSNVENGVVVTYPAFTQRELKLLPIDVFRGKNKYVIPISSLEVSLPEAEKDNPSPSENMSEIILNILKAFPQADVVLAMKEYAEYERSLM